jgi:DNA-binding GntR family transcriptional regulator
MDPLARSGGRRGSKKTGRGIGKEAGGPSKQESAYQLIRRRIERGEYSPGQRLVIDKLAEEIGISQVPIREAIRRLEAESLLSYEPNSGPKVAPLSREVWAQLLETVALLEGYATALAAPRLTPEDLSELKKINTRMSGALREDDLAQVSACNRAFHALILDRCPNAVVVEQLRQSQTRLDSLNRALFAREQAVVMQLLGTKAGQIAVADHESLIKSIRRGTPAATIEQLTREHVLVHLRAVQSAFDRAAKAEARHLF